VIKSKIWAAIDLYRGRVVSLRKGNPADRLTWSSNPLAIANRWEREGASGLHVVDLDGALGEGWNRKVIESISHNSKIPVQVGGGIRSIAQAKELLELGVARVILGTLAYDEPSVLVNALHTLGSERIVVAVDYRTGLIVTRGWTQESSLNVLEAIRHLETAGVKTVLATAVEFDSSALGPDFQMLGKIHASTEMKILASGGIRNLEDVRELERMGIDGAVVGRALYEGTIRLSENSQKA
jgi:phosphoribosylformimino-5-aminoimidazole carboxamide ribotide isomerase